MTPEETREEIFRHIYQKADEAGYMSFDSAESSKFQDQLENDEVLIKLNGGKLGRNYIKDTVLNRYSKDRRYINKMDVLSVVEGLDEAEIIGNKKDLENGSFHIERNGVSILSTSASFGEWQTVLKRFGERSEGEERIAFLTCGGVQKSQSEIAEAKKILKSYGVTALIVKPNEAPVNIDYMFATKRQATAVSVSNALRVPKPFILLAGISGTGKTRFVRTQALLSGRGRESFCLIPVRPDWHEPSDLMGYVSRISGAAVYVVTDILKFITKAWVHVFECGMAPSGTGIAGTAEQLDQLSPYWLCLDEMNLAPVEQYFSSYLSILETRQWVWNEDKFTYCSDGLITSAAIKSVNVQRLRADLSLQESSFDALWGFFEREGIPLPPNLVVAGTVNMDETTHSFSRKVIDRALTFDFEEFYPVKFSNYFKPDTTPRLLTFPVISDARSFYNEIHVDPGFDQTVQFITNVNAVLDKSQFKLAYRALNELLINVVVMNPTTTQELQGVWDDYMMFKILPRIEGDFDKLASYSGTGTTLLHQLEVALRSNFDLIWEGSVRPDFYNIGDSSSGDKLLIECKSRSKINWMKERLEKLGFTSFWP
ncbi:McrB family protein [Pseudomonas coronafaciens]|uniref:McrB family protein n=1 Tax=Pseudomonas coronafaciens TaxID=53409 RepID=UPI000E3CC5A0|nr:hypothetical protein [Pseudomonas coronafaciens]